MAKKKPPQRRQASKRPAPAKRPAVAAQRSRKDKEALALKRRLIFTGVLLVLAGTVVFFAMKPGGGPSVQDRLEAGAGGCAFDREFDGDDASQDDHVPSPTYAVDPPAGGAHLPTPANPGFYEGERVPPDGALVHAMEHGFVVLWVKPGLPADRAAEVAALSDRFGRELIVAERDSLPGEAAVTAWHRRLLCDELAPEKVALFLRSYKDQGPEKGFL